MAPRKSKGPSPHKRNTKGLRRGGPGRQKGSLNKVTKEAREAAAQIVDNPEYRAKLLERALSGKLAPAVETMLWHYAKGKPKDELELTGAAGGPVAFTWLPPQPKPEDA